MYFTLTSVLSYFEGFKLALFNVIFYPKFSQKSYGRGNMGTFKIFQYVKLLLKNKRRSASRNEKSSFRALHLTLNWTFVFRSGLI